MTSLNRMTIDGLIAGVACGEIGFVDRAEQQRVTSIVRVSEDRYDLFSGSDKISGDYPVDELWIRHCIEATAKDVDYGTN